MTTRHLTTDHEEIRHWIQAHHGASARLAHTTLPIGPGQLRIDILDIRHPDLEYPDGTTGSPYSTPNHSP
ncbi:hypothetical protein [Rhodococcus koreensis]|jgi:hypothetical protein|uniref:hypothetical protein n=1 Tax=Rhodococcus koreensis TaxID=99653 RepID=UPI00197FBF39|nr:hypothetical protein [Rhodococcus koreensis]QSE86894.1 hypothetical protein JWS14_48630 [Rhodococcus koreensis]